MEITNLHAAEIAKQVGAGTLTASEVVEAFLKRIQTYNSAYNILLHCDADDARRQAADIDAQISNGEQPGLLAGVPVILKDNICVTGQPTTCGSRILEKYNPPYNAFVTDGIVQQGGIIVGKANMDEFAMGSSTENSAYGAVINPRCPDRVPGGSSGGSAAAVAAGFAPLTLGSDTGGLYPSACIALRCGWF